MSTRLLLVVLGVFLGFVPSSLMAEDRAAVAQQVLATQTGWFVNAAAGNDGNSCLSAGAACKTIGAAIAKAAAGDTIHVAAGVYNEHGLEIDKDLTVQGAGSAVTIIDGGNGGRVLRVGAPATIAGVTIRNGRLATPSPNIFNTGGAAILSNGNLTLRDSVLISNSTIGSGGAIFNLGNLVIDNSAILSNTSEGGGGGVFVYLGTLTISRTLLAGNVTAGQFGGAIESYRPAYLTDVTIRDNTAGSFGGGLVTANIAYLNRVTLQGNRALSGAAIFAQQGGLTLTNVTISHNVAANNHGGIYVSGDRVSLYLQNSTIAYNRRTNSAGNGFNGLISSSSQVRIVNTIFAFNEGRNCGGAETNWTSLGHNLASDATCAFTQAGDLPLVDPMLGPLADYGGAALTHALLAGSPAIDTGDSGNCLAVDQRQVARPFDGNGDATATCDIGAFEARQQVAIADVTVSEGRSGSVGAVFTVTLAPAGAQPVTVDYATVAGSASAGSDFTATAGTLTFDPGQTVRTVTVQVNGDTVDEADETITVELSNASGADIIVGAATGTIVDDDGLSTLSIAGQTVMEDNAGTTNALFTVMLSPASSQNVTVDYSTVDGTATAGQDYDLAAGSLNFSPGLTTTTIPVAVRGDVTDEGEQESFTVNLTNATGATVSDATGAGVITDDDTARLSQTFGPQVNEGDSGRTPALFTIVLSTPAAFVIAVDYIVNSGVGDDGAIEGSDFDAAAGTLTFQPGETARTFTVQVIGDTLFEPDEIFHTLISNGTVAITANGSIGRILNDDGAPAAVVFLPLLEK